LSADVTVHRHAGPNDFQIWPTALHARAAARGFLGEPLAEIVTVREAGLEIERWVRASPTSWRYLGPPAVRR
jgi:hypothetical protein